MDKFCGARPIIDLSNFRGADDKARLDAATRYCRAHPGCTLRVPPGTYTLRSAHATEVEDRVMRGRYGVNAQNVLFKPDFVFDRGLDLEGLRNTVIDGTGARLMADGYWEVIAIRHADNVTVRGFTVDHLRRPYSRGTVEAVKDGWITVRLAPEYPVFPETPFGLRQCLFDSRKEQLLPFLVQETVVRDSHCILCRPDPAPDESWVGLLFYTVHCYHSCPAVLVENSRNVTLQALSIHSHHGMGVVGHRVEDLGMENCRIVPAPGEHFSVNTDATHFTSCKGTVSQKNCIFEAQGDDSVNIHTYYHRIERLSDTACILRACARTHSRGLDHPDAGDVLELTEQKSLRVLARYRVLACEVDETERHAKITLDHPLPIQTDGCLFADATRLPRFVFSGNVCKNHYARGILVKTRGVLIENNLIEKTLGTAIECAAERWWGEGVNPGEIVIRNNRIHACAPQFCVKGAGGISITVDADTEQTPAGSLIAGVTIRDNEILQPDSPHGIYVSHADGVTISGNHILSAAEPVVIEQCTHVVRD